MKEHYTIKQLIAIADARHAKWVDLMHKDVNGDSYSRINHKLECDKAWEAKYEADKALEKELKMGKLGSFPTMNPTDGITWQGD